MLRSKIRSIKHMHTECLLREMTIAVVKSINKCYEELSYVHVKFLPTIVWKFFIIAWREKDNYHMPIFVLQHSSHWWWTNKNDLDNILSSENHMSHTKTDFKLARDHFCYNCFAFLKGRSWQNIKVMVIKLLSWHWYLDNS